MIMMVFVPLTSNETIGYLVDGLPLFVVLNCTFEKKVFAAT